MIPFHCSEKYSTELTILSVVLEVEGQSSELKTCCSLQLPYCCESQVLQREL